MTAAPQGTGLDGLDHVLVGVRDLEAARLAWLRLGFRPCPRGRHIGWGTANYCLMFPNDYVELIGIVDSSKFVNDLDRFLAVREGLLGLAFRGRDLAATGRAIQAAGWSAEGPRSLKRVIELPEGEVQPAFELLFPEPAAVPDLKAFVCRHLTPELVWRKEWLVHPNGATGIRELVNVVDRPGELALTYATLLGDEAVAMADGELIVEVGRCRLRFVTPGVFQAHWPFEAPAPVQPRPWLAGMIVTVADRRTTRLYLEATGVSLATGVDGALYVEPSEVNGVMLGFV
ncbi:Glyoxalase-like domain-containing protein [Tistlia consotensis]|uniref:Glyoxalase-like domain-containing protein n=1 Tax=Tistlia consotensis USBA 355 TaxID=560819 RepID=A0A1Y6CCW4_9PROT|nr:VOC family protein [Tistlia consotensis]SMF46431.1 Glyoxalase-like domain-containing protein [Tistlia consotensis USBA 355]SNR78457.1 Glyoxalase-like domain-containing protein [Tistlia consotensis]